MDRERQNRERTRGIIIDLNEFTLLFSSMLGIHISLSLCVRNVIGRTDKMSRKDQKCLSIQLNSLPLPDLLHHDTPPKKATGTTCTNANHHDKTSFFSLPFPPFSHSSYSSHLPIPPSFRSACLRSYLPSSLPNQLRNSNALSLPLGNAAKY